MKKSDFRLYIGTCLFFIWIIKIVEKRWTLNYEFWNVVFSNYNLKKKSYFDSEELVVLLLFEFIFWFCN